MSALKKAEVIVQEIWREKYRYGDEKSLSDTHRRMARGVCEADPKNSFLNEVETALLERRMVPAGRIHAGAGTDKRVTLINCFVSDDIQDSLTEAIPGAPGLPIMKALDVAAVTQQMGGGIGMDYSTVRPAGALVKRTGSVSSGVLPFMDMWHSMCGTVMSSGSRRGAMMGTLAIWHPDILDFIVAKQTPGRMTNFNISVLVTDPFMEALEKDKDWDLVFTVPRADGEHIDTYERDGKTYYVYKRMKARKLWDLIIENTYIHAEPGIIFVDRANYWNNLHYCEYIHCTNPCGEQPLPPNGDCNLGHVNLAVMVKNPFTPQAEFDYEALKATTGTLVRFLDNVLDVSLFPTEEQRLEAMNKRRTGIGFTGLANALQMLRITYGSPMAVELTRKITREMCFAAYRASIELAKERGPFPLFDAEQYLKGNFIKKLPKDIRDDIKKHGIRNAVLLTIAPTGTTSVVVGNVSSGIEPVIVLEGKRNVLQDDNSFKTFDTYDYGYVLYHEQMNAPLGSIELPDYINCTIENLSVRGHLEMMAAAQEWIDASISKTVNCPESMSFEEFRDVYTMAYKLGLKGCTTYRPDPRSKRGVVISKKEDKPAKSLEKIPMQEVLEGRRYRVKWPFVDQAFYVLIEDYVDETGQRRPFEIFIVSKSAQHEEWIKALTLMITAIFRRGGDVTFIIEELKQVMSPTGGAWVGKKYVNSLVAAIAHKIEEHFKFLGLIQTDEEPLTKALPAEAGNQLKGETCVKCFAPAVFYVEGCKKCTSCGHSACG